METEWDRHNARRARTNFRVLRQALNLERREQRDSETIEERIASVIKELHRIGTAPGREIERKSPSSDALGIPFVDIGIGALKPSQTRQYMDDLVSTDLHARRIAVEVLTLEIDRHRGYLRLEAEETGDDKDSRLIKEFAGKSPAEVYKLDSSLGQPALIKRIRKEHDLNPMTGLSDGSGT